MTNKELPGRWFWCSECESSYRALTTKGLGTSPNYIHGREVCWPCYDDFFDCCYGPDHADFEYRKGMKMVKQLAKWKDQKNRKKENRSKVEQIKEQLRKDGYPRNVSKRIAKELFYSL